MRYGCAFRRWSVALNFYCGLLVEMQRVLCRNRTGLKTPSFQRKANCRIIASSLTHRAPSAVPWLQQLSKSALCSYDSPLGREADCRNGANCRSFTARQLAGRFRTEVCRNRSELKAARFWSPQCRLVTAEIAIVRVAVLLEVLVFQVAGSIPHP